MLNKNLIWVDIETTGLQPESSVILEISCVVTNPQLEILDILKNLVIHYPADKLSRNHMDDWCFTTHTNNALLNASQQSNLTLLEAEKQLLSFLKKWSLPNQSPLCGSSVHFDRSFLKYHLSNVECFFSYRNLDVSSFKEFIVRNYDFDYKKSSNHRAYDDLISSIEELRYYSEHFFLVKPQSP